MNRYTLIADEEEINMDAIANAKYNNKKYDLSIMTCYGESNGNGDASHRLVLFANKVTM